MKKEHSVMFVAMAHAQGFSGQTGNGDNKTRASPVPVPLSSQRQSEAQTAYIRVCSALAPISAQSSWLIEKKNQKKKILVISPYPATIC